MQSILEQTIAIFEWHRVSSALRCKTEARQYSLDNPAIVSNACKTLVSKLRVNESDAIAYARSLDDDLRCCVINNLVGDISSKLIAEMGLEYS